MASRRRFAVVIQEQQLPLSHIPIMTVNGIRAHVIRRFLPILVLAALLGASPLHAQTYPTRPIRVIVPSAAGGGGDIVARAVGQKLAESWGQQVVVDNRNGILGPEIAAKADPDGYTLMLTTSALIVAGSGLPQAALQHDA